MVTCLSIAPRCRRTNERVQPTSLAVRSSASVGVARDTPGAPAYFVLTSAEARAKVKQYATWGIIDSSKATSPDFAERWDKIEAAFS